MFNMKRAKVIHHVLLVLMVVSIGPLGFYGYQLIQFNRDKLQTQERFSQIGIAQSLARLISLYLSNAREQVDGFMASSLDLSSGKELELEGNRGLDKKLEEFVGRSKNLLYINIVNDKGSGIEAGRLQCQRRRDDQALPGKGLSVCQPESDVLCQRAADNRTRQRDQAGHHHVEPDQIGRQRGWGCYGHP